MAGSATSRSARAMRMRASSARQSNPTARQTPLTHVPPSIMARMSATLVRDHRLLDGRAVRDRILDEVAERVRHAGTTHVIGRLVSVSVGEHKAAAVYVRGQASAARRVGLRFEEQIWPSSLTQDECKAR